MTICHLVLTNFIIFSELGFSCSGTPVPLGMQSGSISDSQITASSSSVNYPPEGSRLNGPSAWLPTVPVDSWLMVDFTVNEN